MQRFFDWLEDQDCIYVFAEGAVNREKHVYKDFSITIDGDAVNILSGNHDIMYAPTKELAYDPHEDEWYLGGGVYIGGI